MHSLSTKPKKSLGQNFLANQGICKRVVETADIQQDDIVVEVGPGKGALTFLLAQKAKQVIAVEKDKGLADALAKDIEIKNIKNITIIKGDILKICHSEAIAEESRLRSFGITLRMTDAACHSEPAGEESRGRDPSLSLRMTKMCHYKVVANLPYNIATAVIMKFLTAENKPDLMAVMLQKEVGQRMTAQPPKMSRLAIFSQLYSEIKIAFYIKKENFYPKPKVDSALLLIKPFAEKELKKRLKNLDTFTKIVRAGFNQPRKQLLNNLARGLSLEKSAVENWLKENNLDPKQRPETLSVDDWLKMGDRVGTGISLSLPCPCHSEAIAEESRPRDPCAAAKALATRGRLSPQGDDRRHSA